MQEIPDLCIRDYNFKSSGIEAIREFQTVQKLKIFNTVSNSQIFIQADALVVSYFCEGIEAGYETTLHEFIFNTPKDAQLCKNSLDVLFRKVGFWDMVCNKNWYYKRNGKVVYFLEACMVDHTNPMKVEIQKRLQLIKDKPD